MTCGGYKKDFKWRPFEEATFVGKPTLGKPKKASPSPTSFSSPIKSESPAASETSNHTISNNESFNNAYFPLPQSPTPGMQPPPTPFIDPAYQIIGEAYSMPHPSPYMMPPTSVPSHEQFEPSSVASTNSMFNDAETVDTMPTRTTAPSSISSGQSPRLVDLLLPGTDLSAPTAEYLSFRSQYPDSFYEPVHYNPPQDPMDEDGVEEIPRANCNPDHVAWVMRLPSPTPSSSSSSSSSDSAGFSRDAGILLMEPQFSQGSPEMLTLRYDRQTCGILSVKDGPTENPWRTLIWPLARDSPALYHAIASMTSFHTSKNQPQMRIQGIEHMRTSIHALASGIENMRVDAAIATTLALAFSESWDQHISTGINHIKGAKILVNRALVRHKQSALSGDELNRLKFLCNTWIYMDVIARLTSVDDDESNDFDTIANMFNDPFDPDNEAHLDPLMGCASTLFPVIGRVANLVRKVRRSESNSPSIISQAMELQAQLEKWEPPTFVEPPEDPTSHIQHSLQTAEAYRWATLLYLHQAVPEIPSQSSAALAKKVLVYLATVPLSSRAVIVQIYPLTAAGCEAVEEEDREWVRQRWEAMAQRMVIGIIDRCAEVVKEVWDRRDAHVAEKLKSNRSRNGSSSSLAMSSLKRGLTADDPAIDNLVGWADMCVKRRALSGPGIFDAPRPTQVKPERGEGKKGAEVGTEALEHEFTVKGRLHWLGVMKDWSWEVLLG